MRMPAPPPKRCAVAPAGTRCPSSATTQPLCDWPEVHRPQRSAPQGSLSPWLNLQKTLVEHEEVEEEEEEEEEGRMGGGSRVSTDHGI